MKRIFLILLMALAVSCANEPTTSQQSSQDNTAASANNSKQVQTPPEITIQLPPEQSPSPVPAQTQPTVATYVPVRDHPFNPNFPDIKKDPSKSNIPKKVTSPAKSPTAFKVPVPTKVKLELRVAAILPMDFQDGRPQFLEYWFTDAEGNTSGETFEVWDYNSDLSADAIVYKNVIEKDVLWTVKLWHGPETMLSYRDSWGLEIGSELPAKSSYGFVELKQNEVNLIQFANKESFVQELFAGFDNLFQQVSQLAATGAITPPGNKDSEVEQQQIPLDDKSKQIVLKINTLLARERQKFANYGIRKLANDGTD